MPEPTEQLTEQAIELRAQTLTGKRQEILTEIESLFRDMSRTLSALETIGRRITTMPELVTITNQELAMLRKYYTAAQLQSAIGTMAEIKEAAATSGWSADILPLT